MRPDDRGADRAGERGADARAAARSELHRPFAPQRARTVAVVIGLLALLGGVLLAVLVPQQAVGDRLGFAGFGALVAVFMARQAAVRVLVDEDGLDVRNLFLSRRLAWAEVVSVSFGGGQPWLQLDLADGETLAVMAVQRADGARAEGEARRMATLVALHGPRDDG